MLPILWSPPIRTVPGLSNQSDQEIFTTEMFVHQLKNPFIRRTNNWQTTSDSKYKINNENDGWNWFKSACSYFGNWFHDLDTSSSSLNSSKKEAGKIKSLDHFILTDHISSYSFYFRVRQHSLHKCSSQAGFWFNFCPLLTRFSSGKPLLRTLKRKYKSRRRADQSKRWHCWKRNLRIGSTSLSPFVLTMSHLRKMMSHHKIVTLHKRGYKANDRCFKRQTFSSSSSNGQE